MTAHPALRVAPQVGYAIIGVARLSGDYELRAFRLLSDPRHAPAVLYGMPGAPHGTRELVAEHAWDPPSVAAGATTQVSVSVPGARPGDFAQAAFRGLCDWANTQH